MQDPAIQSFRRLRQAEKFLAACDAANDEFQAEDAFADVVQEALWFSDTKPCSQRGAFLKLKECVKDLQDGGADTEAMLLRMFLRRKGPVNGAWLRDLRLFANTVTGTAPHCGFALNCMKAVLAGMAGPRLVQ